MKTMTIDKLRERGLKSGDLFYNESNQSGFTGWYLILGEHAISLNTGNRQAWISRPMSDAQIHQITKIITILDLGYVMPTDVALFFKTFDETLIERAITKITHKPLARYLNAVHFGSTKVYTWRVPEHFQLVEFKVGDVVEVDTIKGNQLVQVKEVAEYEYDDTFKTVVGLVKTYDIPF